MKKPNVLFILTDDQRYGTIGALGNPEIQTPNMDRLVHAGTSFINAHIPGGTASAICMPSRAMIHSGKTLFHLEECGKNIPADHVCLGENFLKAGYRSHCIGKWHNGVESNTRSFDSGENIFFGGMWDHWNVPVCDYKSDGDYPTIPFVPNFTANQATVDVIAEKIHAGVHSTQLFTDSAVKFIKAYNEDKPFFLYLSFLAPHDPRTMPERFRTMYDPSKITLPPNFLEMPSFSFGWAAKGRDENTEAYPRKPEKIRQHIADYYAMISHIDWCLGAVLQALDDRGFTKDTIIVFCGDNGLAIGQHGLMGKQNLYEHSLRVPLILAGPGIPADRQDERLVYLLDIYPTLCDLCSIPIPGSVEGLSMVPMLNNAKTITREYLYLAFHGRIRGIMDKRFKLIEYRTDKIRLTQLFDWQQDPWETNNLFDMSGYDEVTERLREKLYEYRDAWDDESILLGQQYWQQWRQYQDAEVHGVGEPKGINMAAQVKSWDTVEHQRTK